MGSPEPGTDTWVGQPHLRLPRSAEPRSETSAGRAGLETTALLQPGLGKQVAPISQLPQAAPSQQEQVLRLAGCLPDSGSSLQHSGSPCPSLRLGVEGGALGGPDPPGSRTSSPLQDGHRLLFANRRTVCKPKARDLSSVLQTKCSRPPRFTCDILKPDAMTLGGGAVGSPNGDPSEME